MSEVRRLKSFKSIMKLSIITVNLNNHEGLKKTLDSVACQTWRDFEHIIIDGASTDGSVEVIREYEKNQSGSLYQVDSHSSSPFILQSQIQALGHSELKGSSFRSQESQPSTINHRPYTIKWLSEPDTGIYNAMNKGIRMANGEYLLFLNSGDFFVDSNVVESVLPCLDSTDIVQGNTISLVDGRMQIERGYGRSDIDYIDVQKGHFLHQASFCKKVLFEKYGYYDESYRIDGDTVFFIRCLGKGNASFKYVDRTIAFFDGGGLSDNSNEKWAQQRAKEFARWSSEEFSKRQWDTCVEYDKKGRLYDKLHRHKWSWCLTMAMVRLMTLFEK